MASFGARPWRAIETYAEPIPDDALKKYDDAVQSDLFAKFWVVTARYYDQLQQDPWIVAQVTGSELYAVIAQSGSGPVRLVGSYCQELWIE